MLRLVILTLLVLGVSAVNLSADNLAKDTTAAEAGDFDAMLRVGLAYLSDKDEANNEAGVKWLEMSTAGGNVVAYFNLGTRYERGDGVKQDPQKALMYLTIAAELGEARAMNQLAGIYYLGKLVPANDILAVKWGLLASGFGSEKAQENLDKMQESVDERAKVLGGKAAAAWMKNRFPKKSVSKKTK